MGREKDLMTMQDETERANYLRRRAEDALLGKLVDLEGLPVEDIQSLLHELQVYQIELTLQNEELRRVQMELETSRDRYSDLYNFAPTGYCTLDRKDRILEANQTLANMLGVEQAKLIQIKLSHFVQRENQDEYYLHHQRTFDTQQSQVIDIQIKRKTGDSFTAQLESQIDHEDNRRIRVIISDITKRKRVEKELEYYTQELERSNKALQDFSTIASHDLQEPLRKVHAFGQLLETRFSEELGVEGKDYIARINSAAERMSTMLQGLLAIAAVTSRGQNFVDVDLNKIVADVLTDLEARLLQTGGKVELGELPSIQADPLQMQQLFQNLIANALKYHFPDVPPLVRVTSRQLENNCVELMVSDDGIGIDMKYADRIFEPFYRLNGRSAYEGTGMGLAICKKIVERHGGSIRVESVPCQGSTFTIILTAGH